MIDSNSPEPGCVDVAFVRSLGARLRVVIGEPFNEILRLDIKSRAHHLPGRPRHLLPELLENSIRGVRELEAGHASPFLGDLVTLHALTSTFERLRTDPGFSSMRSGFKDHRHFRHDVVTLCYVDHLRRNTPYDVQLPIDPCQFPKL